MDDKWGYPHDWGNSPILQDWRAQLSVSTFVLVQKSIGWWSPCGLSMMVMSVDPWHLCSVPTLGPTTRARRASIWLQNLGSKTGWLKLWICKKRSLDVPSPSDLDQHFLVLPAGSGCDSADIHTSLGEMMIDQWSRGYSAVLCCTQS